MALKRIDGQPFSFKKKSVEIVSPNKETRDISASSQREMQIPKETKTERRIIWH